MQVIDQQNGGSDAFWPEELDPTDSDASDPELKYIYQKRRSYILATITSRLYHALIPQLNKLRNGKGDTRSGALSVKVFQPGETIEFERTLLTTEDYCYPTITKSYSIEYSDDVIEKSTDLSTYRLMAVDLIWCREDTLFQRLNVFLEKIRYHKYIYKVLKNICWDHDDQKNMKISERSMEMVDNMVSDVFDQIMDNAARLARYTKGNTITEREIQTAVRLVLHGELGKQATLVGQEAVTRYDQ